VSINHAGQIPSVTMSFNLQDGVALGTAVDEVRRISAATLPGSITTNFSGTAQAFQDTQAGLMSLLVIAIFVIYVVLGVLYESFIHPLTILSGLPFAAFGALITLLVFIVQLSVYAFVGIILLIGLVKKNAIMMTTLAALVGTMPIALAMGAGAESRRPLGVAVVGGLAFSQFITLYITPVVYIYMDKGRHWAAAKMAALRARRTGSGRELAHGAAGGD
jgi:HAE1 family hydrophobic/amphiphilic exporter-1